MLYSEYIIGIESAQILDTKSDLLYDACVNNF
jgi:hypothetical protein